MWGWLDIENQGGNWLTQFMIYAVASPGFGVRRGMELRGYTQKILWNSCNKQWQSYNLVYFLLNRWPHWLILRLRFCHLTDIVRVANYRIVLARRTWACQVQTRQDHTTMSERYCSSVLGCSLHSSLCDCIKATSAFCCQSSAGCAVISTEFLRTSGLLCCRSDDVELSTETVAWSCPHHLRVCMLTEDISFLLSTSVYSALGAVFSVLMRYINWCSTYLLTHGVECWSLFALKWPEKLKSWNSRGMCPNPIQSNKSLMKKLT